MQVRLNEVVPEIKNRVNEISEFLSGKSLTDFEADRTLQLAVEQNYWVTGKLMSRLTGEGGEAAGRTKELISVSNFDLDYADRLVTEYENVKIRDVWNSLQRSLPILKQQINVWADELGMEPPPEQTR